MFEKLYKTGIAPSPPRPPSFLGKLGPIYIRHSCAECSQRAHRHIPTEQYPQIVGSIHPLLKLISNWHVSPNYWQSISNTNTYLSKCTLPNLVPERHTDTFQLNNIPQLLAVYIQFKYIFIIGIYPPIVGSICAAHNFPVA